MGGWLAADDGVAVLADGREVLPWGELPGRIATLEAHLRGAGVAPDEPLALECSNTLACALAVIHGLEAGRTLVMLPPEEATPDFCSVGLRFAADADLPEVQRAAVADEISGGARPAAGQIYVSTSGTTGASRYVVHDQARLLENARACALHFGLRAGDRIALPVPIHHLFGLGAAFLPALLAGASLDLQAGANLPRFMARERAFDPDVAFLTPAFADALVRGRRGTRRYRLTVVAGDRLPEETFDRYEERFGPVVQLYGSSEMGAIACTRPEDSRSVRRASVGRPLAGVRLRLAAQPSGELECLHAHGFVGYAQASGEISTRRGAEDWHPTRDRARFDPDGNLVLLGRLDHRVNRDGLVVSLGEVEAALAGLDGVTAAVAASAGATARGAGIVAFCTTGEGGSDASGLRRELFARLPRRAVPDVIEILDSLPLLANGKLDRQGLTRRAADLIAGEQRAPLEFLQLEPTTRCNFVCGFCAGRHMDQSDLGWSTFEAALAAAPGLRHLELQGEGEPLLHPQFFEMVSYATARGIWVSSISNGSFFTPDRVAALLDSDIGSILVSLESPDADEFQRIRGGKLGKVTSGIRLLLEERRRTGRSHPLVGFAVTVLESTQHRLPEIAALYDELGMDGGICVQMLNPMESYARHYDEVIAEQVLAPLAQALVWSRWGRIRARRESDLSGREHFFSELLEESEAAAAGCPWLARSLYVDRHGVAGSCPYRKGSPHYALGRLDTDGVEAILAARDALHATLRSGTVPAGCGGCAIAERVTRGVAAEAACAVTSGAGSTP